ncbi:hypothetical protein EG858_15635, partial [Enterococcus faecalis]
PGGGPARGAAGADARAAELDHGAVPVPRHPAHPDAAPPRVALHAGLCRPEQRARDPRLRLHGPVRPRWPAPGRWRWHPGARTQHTQDASLFFNKDVY